VRRFWDPVVRPVLEAVGARHVIEIGAGDGRHTQRLARWCRRHRGRLDAIDPFPDFDVAALEAGDSRHLRVHVARSLDVLAGLLPADVVLIDGDHNWYTVYHELTTLFGEGPSLAADAPIVICHDVGWPYGRRDLYYDPASIPEDFRQPWRRGGLSPVEPGFAAIGLNAMLCHAEREGGERNGVRTAITDALRGREDEVRTVWIDVIFGLGLLVPRARLAAHPGLGEWLDRLELPPAWRTIAGIVEQERVQGMIAVQRMAALAGEPARVPAGPRPFTTAIPPPLLRTMQHGTMTSRYKGRAMLLDPFDMANYLVLLGALAPGTVFEIGVYEGGRSVWLADMMAALGLAPNVIAIDLVPPAALADPRIRCLKGDARDLGSVLDEGSLAALPRPFLVIEDSAHDAETCSAVLDFFDRHLRPGEYVVVEDGLAAAALSSTDAETPPAAAAQAIAAFLARRADAYTIDATYCDRFGYNATSNPNGWLRRR